MHGVNAPFVEPLFTKETNFHRGIVAGQPGRPATPLGHLPDRAPRTTGSMLAMPVGAPLEMVAGGRAHDGVPGAVRPDAPSTLGVE
jgi:hypothetical protein